MSRRLRTTPRRRPEGENTISLINVVFLLLIFFLVAGSLSAPRDASIDLATAEGFDRTAMDPAAIYVDGGGRILVAGVERDAAAAVTAAREAATREAIAVVPDRTLDAARLLGILAEIQAAAADVPLRLLTRRPAPGEAGADG